MTYHAGNHGEDNVRRPLALFVAMLVGVGLVAVPARARPAEARPVKPPPTGTPTVMPVEFLAYGAARCLALLGRWEVVWRFELNGDEARIVHARDHLSGTVLSWTPDPFSGGGTVGGTATGRIAGDRTVAGLTAQILVTGEATPRTVVRTLPLGAACATETATPECADVESARYAHTFDGAAGTTTVEIVGPRLCSGVLQDFLLDSKYWHDADSEFLFQGLNFERFTLAVRRIAMSTEPVRCRSRIALAVGFQEVIDRQTGELREWIVAGSEKAPGNRSSGPFAGSVVDEGTCIAPKAYAWSQCDGSLIILMTNGLDAAMRVTLLISSAFSGDDTWRWVSVPPGGSVSVRLPRTGNPMGYYVQAWNAELGRFVWEAPATCRTIRPGPLSGTGVARRYSI